MVEMVEAMVVVAPEVAVAMTWNSVGRSEREPTAVAVEFFRRERGRVT